MHNRDKEKKITISEKATSRDYVCAMILILVPAFIVVIVCKYVLLLSSVMSGSMEPTLTVGKLAVYNRLAYVNDDIKRGDIITFYSEEFGIDMAKRVIGIPGDTISFVNGAVILNNEILDEREYLPDCTATYCDSSFLVPEGCVFVLGDDREHSFDSRYFKQPFISEDTIEGKFVCQLGPSLNYYLSRIGETR